MFTLSGCVFVFAKTCGIRMRESLLGRVLEMHKFNAKHYRNACPVTGAESIQLLRISGLRLCTYVQKANRTRPEINRTYTVELRSHTHTRFEPSYVCT